MVYRFDHATLIALVEWVGEQVAADVVQYRERLETTRRGQRPVQEQLDQAEARLAVLQAVVRYLHVRSEQGVLALETLQLLGWAYRRRPGDLADWRPHGYDMD